MTPSVDIRATGSCVNASADGLGVREGCGDREFQDGIGLGWKAFPDPIKKMELGRHRRRAKGVKP